MWCFLPCELKRDVVSRVQYSLGTLRTLTLVDKEMHSLVVELTHGVFLRRFRKLMNIEHIRRYISKAITLKMLPQPHGLSNERLCSFESLLKTVVPGGWREMRAMIDEQAQKDKINAAKRAVKMCQCHKRVEKLETMLAEEQPFGERVTRLNDLTALLPDCAMIGKYVNGSRRVTLASLRDCIVQAERAQRALNQERRRRKEVEHAVRVATGDDMLPHLYMLHAGASVEAIVELHVRRKRRLHIMVQIANLDTTTPKFSVQAFMHLTANDATLTDKAAVLAFAQFVLG